MDKKIWFKNKTYGWGWTPASIEGWLVTASYVAINVGYSYLAKTGSIDFSPEIFFAILILSTVAFIFICYKKGEKPEWRWGSEK